MNVISFPRGDLTAELLLWLAKDNSFLIGDAVAPEHAGWDDNPNTAGAKYHPYVVVTPLTANPSSGSIAETNAYMIVPYSLTFYGVSRAQLEWMSDRSREIAVNLARSDYVLRGLNQADSWKVMQAQLGSLGGISRSDNVEPSLYTQTDVINIYISKEF